MNNARSKPTSTTKLPSNDTVMFAIHGVNRQLRDKFIGLCKMRGKTGKEVIEAFLDAFIKAEERGLN